MCLLIACIFSVQLPFGLFVAAQDLYLGCICTPAGALLPFYHVSLLGIAAPALYSGVKHAKLYFTECFFGLFVNRVLAY